MLQCAITDGKLGCSSGGKSTSITLGYSVHCYAISLAGGQLQFRSSTPSIHQMLKTKKIPITSVSHQQHVCYCIRTCDVICTR
ncbi:hypothetical protein T12_16709 [Trichinella patagoniensis]|uniref:Uncharacterized protein n=1 Tax=Trichinella patagoniensis TaxID=990121 RepID=A0A0V1ACX6_9BILA|nr:hypothetical protein T12_16709 [Trichinella patagoniensis]